MDELASVCLPWPHHPVLYVPLLLLLVSLASSRQSSEERRRLVTQPSKGLGVAWLSPRVDEGPFVSVATSGAVCPSGGPSGAVQWVHVSNGSPCPSHGPSQGQHIQPGTRAPLLGAGSWGHSDQGSWLPGRGSLGGLFALPCTLYRRVYLMMGVRWVGSHNQPQPGECGRDGSLCPQPSVPQTSQENEASSS